MTRPATRPRPAGVDVRRHRLVYGIPVWAVDRTTGRIIPGQVRVGYIGQSVQTVKEREDQHREGRFGDLIVGGSFTIAEGSWTKQELDDWEEHYIRTGVPLTVGGPTLRPVYNDTHNRGNPDRIEVWRAIKHRQTRQPGWVPPAKDAWVPRQRSVPPRAPRPSAARQRRRIRWTKRRIRFALGTAGWLAIAIPVSVWVAGTKVATAQDGLITGAGAASVVVGVLLGGRRRRRRRRR